MEEDFTAALLNNAALVALVGGAGKARIHWEKLPDRAAVPAIVLRLVSAPKSHTMKGREPTTRNFVSAECLGGTKAEAVAVRDAYLAALDAMKARPLKAFPESTFGDWETTGGPDARGQTDTFREIVDATVWHNVAA